MQRIDDSARATMIPSTTITARANGTGADHDGLDTFEAACRAADGKLAAADNQSSEPEIERLAKLPRLEYERQREDTARLLGVRVAALDKIVREQRTAAEDDAATLRQNTPLPQSGTSEACKRASADEMGTTNDFRSVQKDTPHGSKNGNVSYSHAGLHACTDRNGGNGGEGCSDQDQGPGNAPLCAQCGRLPPDGLEEQYPIGRELVWLHRECHRFYVTAYKQTS